MRIPKPTVQDPDDKLVLKTYRLDKSHDAPVRKWNPKSGTPPPGISKDEMEKIRAEGSAARFF